MSPDRRLLEVSGLGVTFPSDQGPVRAVDGVSLHMDGAETLGLVGESGCGKTVTALSLLGLLGSDGRITEGSSVMLRGEELMGLGDEDLRHVRGNDVAMIFQEPAASLNPVFTVGEQIIESLRLHRGLGGRAARAEAVRLLEEVGMPAPAARVDEYPHQLSGGMSQRVMIAMALACDPALLIADEPTTALDPTVQAQILELLARLRTERGMAILLISHDLSVVAEICDRIAVMYAGQIVETGTVASVFAEPAHPYTRALLDAMAMEPEEDGTLRAISGSVPNPTAWPPGCRFRPRCPAAFDRCVAEPSLFTLSGDGRACRCWLSESRAVGAARESST